MMFHRKSRRALPWLVLAGLVAAVAIPAGAAAKPIPASYSTSTGTIQIGGQLVTPSQLSAWQASASRGSTNGLVQIGGKLVTPAQASALQSRLGSSTQVVSSSSGDGFNWSALSAGMVGFVLLAGVSGYALRMRRRVTTTA